MLLPLSWLAEMIELSGSAEEIRDLSAFRQQASATSWQSAIRLRAAATAVTATRCVEAQCLDAL